MFGHARGWVLCDETNGDGDGNGSQGGAAPGAGGEGGGDGNAADAGGEGGGEAGGEGDPAPGDKGAAPKDMKSAIDAGLGYKKDAEGYRVDASGKRTHNPDGSPIEEKKPAAGKETETHHANGKPKKNEKGQDLDPEGKVVQKGAPKVKTSAELALKPEELKLLGEKTRARFGEVISALKQHEATLAKQAGEIKTLAAGRDAILGLMEETSTSRDQLAGYLHFNGLLHSGKPEDLEAALGIIEQQRVAIYKALGKEPKGGDVDLLADFPDLAQQVEEEEITRAAALEIAKGRREKAARDAAAKRADAAKNADSARRDQAKADGDKALKDIEAWTAELKKNDLDYAAKEDKLLEKLDEVLEEYPPNKWLSTLKLLYGGIVIEKAPPAGGKQQLRPSGARPGAKAPTDMLEAINQGLGYATGKG